MRPNIPRTQDLATTQMIPAECQRCHGWNPRGCDPPSGDSYQPLQTTTSPVGDIGECYNRVVFSWSTGHHDTSPVQGNGPWFMHSLSLSP